MLKIQNILEHYLRLKKSNIHSYVRAITVILHTFLAGQQLKMSLQFKKKMLGN